MEKKQSKKEDREVKKVLFGMGVLVLIVLGIVFTVHSIRSFSYEGVDFKVVKFCDTQPCLILYNTKVPISYQGQKYDYNFYLRNDPRKLAEDIPFEGNLSLAYNVVIDSQKEFNCDGDIGVAMANWINLFKISEITPIKDPNATCDSQGRYVFINITEAGENETTSIEQYGPLCYEMKVNNCEILKVTERFMVEDLVRINNIMESRKSE